MTTATGHSFGACSIWAFLDWGKLAPWGTLALVPQQADGSAALGCCGVAHRDSAVSVLVLALKLT